jgi:hypothetical protein
MVVAESTDPSTGQWKSFVYTVANWLIPSQESGQEIYKFQPVSKNRDDDWTDNFEEAVKWFRLSKSKRIKTA